LLTTGEVARLLQVTPNGVRWLVRDGRLDCARTHSGVRLFHPETVMQLVQQRATARIRSRGEMLAALRLRMLKADIAPRQLTLDFHARLTLVGSRGKGRRVA
jgi:excisionase family DNA binding protein